MMKNHILFSGLLTCVYYLPRSSLVGHNIVMICLIQLTSYMMLKNVQSNTITSYSDWILDVSPKNSYYHDLLTLFSIYILLSYPFAVKMDST